MDNEIRKILDQLPSSLDEFIQRTLIFPEHRSLYSLFSMGNVTAVCTDSVLDAWLFENLHWVKDTIVVLTTGSDRMEYSILGISDVIKYSNPLYYALVSDCC